MRRVAFRKAAIVEFEAAARWYEDESTGLGARFIDAADAAVERARRHPLLYGESYRGLRGVGVRRFPYTVYFRHEPDRIVVVAVFHDRRDPVRWRLRR